MYMKLSQTLTYTEMNVHNLTQKNTMFNSIMEEV